MIPIPGTCLYIYGTIRMLGAICEFAQFINNFTMLKSQCRRIFDLAAAISISSSRRIFMAKSCQEWCVDF